jgi:hypothetical protein
MDFGLYVGTVGTSVWSSEDLGKTWARPIDVGLYLECRVFSLTSQPSDGSSVLAGTDQGVYRWHAADKRWEHLPSVLDELPIWSLVQSPHDPNVMLAARDRLPCTVRRMPARVGSGCRSNFRRIAARWSVRG